LKSAQQAGFFEQYFSLSLPFYEILIRGSVTYLALFFLLRLILKRESGSLAMSDIIVVVLLGDAAQSAMAGDSKTILDGLLLIVTILFWAYILDWMPYQFPSIEKLFRSKPLIIVKNGKMIRKNMRKEFITPSELHQQLRIQGCDTLSQIKEAYLEDDGQISVICTENK
jgi:uncharacterized membrane protein YcaP (DUF421 family)